jgi:triosephosphate isomerase
MPRRPRPLIAGNWKMNGLKRDLAELRKLTTWLRTANPGCDVMICPPATLISAAKALATGSRIKIGAQLCHQNDAGAHTGDVSAAMLKNTGASAVIAGHSERRADHGETNKHVCAQAEAIHRVGLTAIICIGETAGERKAGKTLQVVGAQLKGSLPSGASARNTIIAYEPVWAIGTGLTATPDDVAKVHRHIRKRLVALMGANEGAKIRILYGGSVKADNAAALMAVKNVDGALVGGASLKARDFQGIISAYL